MSGRSVGRSGLPEPAGPRGDPAHDERVDAYDQGDLVHRLPAARLVDRVDWLTDRCRGERVIHVGFVDAGFRHNRQHTGRWLHAHLAGVAGQLAGIDADTDGVRAAVAQGYEAHAADCTDRGAVAALGLAPADVVVAGEVIEHIDAPGPFLDGLHPLCRPGGRLIVTTPNAAGLVNVAASVVRRVEVNHPDHVVMFTWRTLTELMRRHGWTVVESAVYVPPAPRRARRSRLDWLGTHTVLAAERALARLGRPFCADGLIVVAEPATNSAADPQPRPGG